MNEIPAENIEFSGIGSSGFEGTGWEKRGDRRGTFGSGQGSDMYGGRVFGSYTPVSYTHLALAGTFLITTGGDPSQMALPPAGLAFGLLAALGGAGLAVFPGKILSTYGVSAVNGWAMLLVGLIAAPFVPDWGQAVASFDISCWVVFGALVVLGTWCSYLFYMQGVHEIGSLKTAMLSTVEPISATVLSALWIGVVFSPTDLLGFAMIIIMMPLVA